MKRGHVTGQRRQANQASAWYAAIEAATLARLEAAWPETPSPLQDVQQEPYAPARPESFVTHRAIPVYPEHSEELSNGLHP